MASTTRKALRKSLARWFSRSRRELPWRQTRDPYRIWVSEVMLQQTQVQTVLPYYSKFTKRFPNVESLSEASLDSILKSWEGLGYYARARNLHRAAKIVSSEMDGNLPDNYEALRALPGVGDYIASAVLSVAFDRAYAVVDGNVKRVLARLLTIDEPVNKSSSSKVFKAVAEQLLDGESPGDFNQAMMELGAIVCRSSKPNCAACPVNKFCKAFETGMQDAFPVRIRKRPVPTYHIAVGVVRRSGRILITRRKPTGFLGGLWEFPGGKVKPGESPEEACKREIKEEMNLSIDVGKHLTKVKHAYSHFKVSIDVFDCRYRAGSVRLNGPEDYRWIVLEEIDDYAFPGANHKFIPLLKEKKLSPSSNKELPKA
ncbi:MAG: A/G-specific adenine glycosylase [Candidatus Latescibacteria bacterium]|nr:A/G-specific adenine glycosylase [Candidatus Latescibacterota bacterium]NIO00984.1 A/G-specific adenine glycosylase [Candidatus Latescibacterota bacterium]NIO27383.1 A/G-specific adenine glycosylase [Candidatus Latescibacterota bacterium]NIO54905.1 A/G-specific adenine glycosylase [Candidatus Latescibacterota bacterium]NIT00994.1 A/G-specific adenine glycosylase [Candidatus Latescibacterota bacterium]